MITQNVLLFAASIFVGTVLGLRGDDLQRGFENPPDSARPHVWWHWMNGNVSKAGITADLEAMKEAGVGGAQIFDATCFIPSGPVKFNSPEWMDCVKWAATEVRRLGLELCVHNCSGWSSSGGPWNKPENAMKFVYCTEKSVKGPFTFDAALARPENPGGFYADIAVLAFKTPAAELDTMTAAKVSLSCPLATDAKQIAALMDNDRSTGIVFREKSDGKPSHEILFTFPKPYTARACTFLLSGEGGFQPRCPGRLEISKDGTNFKEIQSFNLPLYLPLKQTVTFPPVEARFFRVIFFPKEKMWCKVREIELSGKIFLSNLSAKIFRDRGDCAPDPDDTLPDQIVKTGEMINLTKQMTADGHLRWDVPEGNWTLLRVGHAANGRVNAPATPEGTGLECDKLCRAAVDAHFAGYVGKLVENLGALAGNVTGGLNHVLIDSYEVGTQNWTQDFEKEFKASRGYDITPFLPVLSGRIVDSVDVTERFLWDYRRVIADLFAENYAGGLARLAHRAGLKFSCEPYGNCPTDDLQYGQDVDIPMGEFWPGEPGNVNIGNVRIAASLAHVWGRKIAGAEAFTARPPAGKWLKDPYALKAQGDRVFCAGINRMIYHRYAHQPWTAPTYYPGMTMGRWGTHFERTLTWWKQGREWLKYQARCQYLLQEGRFVADAVFFCGEDAPNDGMAEKKMMMPAGYACDTCATAALLAMTVQDGNIVLPSGMVYRLLVLPGSKTMTLGTLEAVGRLVAAGAMVVGTKPERSPGYSGYPAVDGKIRELAERIWAKGVLTCPVTEALKSLHIQPDCFCADKQAQITYIHRRAGGTEVYFVAQPQEKRVTAICSFRASGKVPEFWHPDTGAMERVPEYRVADGITTLPVTFEPAGSVFVVFRESDSGDHVTQMKTTVMAKEGKSDDAVSSSPDYELAAASDGMVTLKAWRPLAVECKTAAGRTLKAQALSVPAPQRVEGPWKLSFPPAWGAPGQVTLDQLISWTEHPDKGVKYFSGTATYAKSVTVNHKIADNERVMLDLGAVKNFAEVEVNGVPYPVLWKPPFTLDITDAAKKTDGAFALTVRVTNLWPNRLIGDDFLPADCQWDGDQLREIPQWVKEGKKSPTGRLTFTTWRHWTKEDKPLDSGILGPVFMRSVITVQTK